MELNYRFALGPSSGLKIKWCKPRSERSKSSSAGFSWRGDVGRRYYAREESNEPIQTWDFLRVFAHTVVVERGLSFFFSRYSEIWPATRKMHLPTRHVSAKEAIHKGDAKLSILTFRGPNLLRFALRKSNYLSPLVNNAVLSLSSTFVAFKSILGIILKGLNQVLWSTKLQSSSGFKASRRGSSITTSSS